VLAAELKEGQWLAIVGSGGGLGHLGIQFAKALGLKVIGIDARDEGLKLSKQYGADTVVDARNGDKSVVKAVHSVTSNVVADVTIKLSDAKTAAATACAVTRMHGKMIQVAQVRVNMNTTAHSAMADMTFSLKMLLYRSANYYSEI
jgi:propanol-preferring alcohol dehydrogenase